MNGMENIHRCLMCGWLIKSRAGHWFVVSQVPQFLRCNKLAPECELTLNYPLCLTDWFRPTGTATGGIFHRPPVEIQCCFRTFALLVSHQWYVVWSPIKIWPQEGATTHLFWTSSLLSWAGAIHQLMAECGVEYQFAWWSCPQLLYYDRLKTQRIAIRNGLTKHKMLTIT